MITQLSELNWEKKGVWRGGGGERVWVKCGKKNIFSLSLSLPPWQFNLTNMCVSDTWGEETEKARETEREREREGLHSFPLRSVFYRAFDHCLQSLCVCACDSTAEEGVHVQLGQTRSRSFSLSSIIRLRGLTLQCSVKTIWLSLALFSIWHVGIVPQLWHHSQMFWTVWSIQKLTHFSPAVKNLIITFNINYV